VLTALQVAGVEALQVPHTLWAGVAVVFGLALEVGAAVVAAGLLVAASFVAASPEYAVLIEELEVAEAVELYDDGDAICCASDVLMGRNA
jgi:uncharacterized membrane protein YphA (DoxX/SURF4 family)